jgi:hypothetical protein
MGAGRPPAPDASAGAGDVAQSVAREVAAAARFFPRHQQQLRAIAAHENAAGDAFSMPKSFTRTLGSMVAGALDAIAELDAAAMVMVPVAPVPVLSRSQRTVVHALAADMRENGRSILGTPQRPTRDRGDGSYLLGNEIANVADQVASALAYVTVGAAAGAAGAPGLLRALPMGLSAFGDGRAQALRSGSTAELASQYGGARMILDIAAFQLWPTMRIPAFVPDQRIVQAMIHPVTSAAGSNRLITAWVAHLAANGVTQFATGLGATVANQAATALLNGAMNLRGAHLPSDAPTLASVIASAKVMGALTLVTKAAGLAVPTAVALARAAPHAAATGAGGARTNPLRIHREPHFFPYTDPFGQPPPPGQRQAFRFTYQHRPDFYVFLEPRNQPLRPPLRLDQPPGSSVRLWRPPLTFLSPQGLKWYMWSRPGTPARMVPAIDADAFVSTNRSLVWPDRHGSLQNRVAASVLRNYGAVTLVSRRSDPWLAAYSGGRSIRLKQRGSTPRERRAIYIDYQSARNGHLSSPVLHEIGHAKYDFEAISGKGTWKNLVMYSQHGRAFPGWTGALGSYDQVLTMAEIAQWWKNAQRNVVWSNRDARAALASGAARTETLFKPGVLPYYASVIGEFNDIFARSIDELQHVLDVVKRRPLRTAASPSRRFDVLLDHNREGVPDEAVIGDFAHFHAYIPILATPQLRAHVDALKATPPHLARRREQIDQAINQEVYRQLDVRLHEARGVVRRSTVAQQGLVEMQRELSGKREITAAEYFGVHGANPRPGYLDRLRVYDLINLRPAQVPTPRPGVPPRSAPGR